LGNRPFGLPLALLRLERADAIDKYSARIEAGSRLRNQALLQADAARNIGLVAVPDHLRMPPEGSCRRARSIEQDTLERRASNTRRWCPQWYKHPEVVTRFKADAVEAAPGSPALLGHFIEADYRAWRNVVKTQNLQIE